MPIQEMHPERLSEHMYQFAVGQTVLEVTTPEELAAIRTAGIVSTDMGCVKVVNIENNAVTFDPPVNSAYESTIYARRGLVALLDDIGRPVFVFMPDGTVRVRDMQVSLATPGAPESALVARQMGHLVRDPNHQLILPSYM